MGDFLVAMYLKQSHVLKPYSKFQNSNLKELKSHNGLAQCVPVEREQTGLNGLVGSGAML